MATNSRILVIEDDPGIALALYKNLTKASYQVATAKTGSSGLRKALDKRFEIVLLDLGLPDMSGLSICRELRAEKVQYPIIVLTADATIQSKVSLFDAGANDYVIKPFSIDELLARIRTALRVNINSETEEALIVGPIKLDRVTRTVTRDNQLITLRRKESAILECLMLHVGRPVTRSGLMRYAWDGNDDSWTNTIDVHIKHLRDRIDRDFDQQLIHTVHGIGYKLALQQSATGLQYN